MHTQGEWCICPLAAPDYAPQIGVYAGDSQRGLATVVGPNARADAHLIAAAPLMLKALEVIAEFLSEHPEFQRGNSKVHYCAQLARSAIAETKGD